MSRKDIANYLGLTLETVSRTFTHLQTEGLIDVLGKRVQIKDRQRLRQLTHALEGEAASPGP